MADQAAPHQQTDRWVNAVMRIRQPIDVPIDADGEAKRDAALEAFESDPRLETGQNDSVVIGFEDVEDGEPLKPDPAQTAERLAEALEPFTRLDADPSMDEWAQECAAARVALTAFREGSG